jgi:hypothetical protein
VVPHLEWPGAAQVARIWRERRIGDKVSTEVAYIVTSLDALQAPPERLLALVRAHWGIENRLHHVRDVSFEEDRCRSRAGGSAGMRAQSGAGDHPRPWLAGSRGPRELPRGPRRSHRRRHGPIL